MKELIAVQPAPETHWVGDGFPVRSMFGPNSFGGRLSPFLLLDYGGPAVFEPSAERRGVDAHPHKGFETVTIVYQGGIEHRDSKGNSGKIGPGDVQWMTAASGLLHEERHSEEFARAGGPFEMVQLWVNLPAAHKQDPPRYQELLSALIPTVDVPGGSVRVIAGEFQGVQGAAKTFTPVEVLDIQLGPGSQLEIPLAEEHSAAVLILEGTVALAEGITAEAAQLAVFDSIGEGISLRASQATRALILSGEPIKEPIAAYGPFVMNTAEEIQAAFEEYRSGKMGRLTEAAAH